jgi:tRNA dimethylallyltransferase
MQKNDNNAHDLIVITGPTATGKTRLAAELAHKLNGEIIGADSRQVYKNMDIGTGKDMVDYLVDGQQMPVHLVDKVEPGYEFNVFEFRQEFLKAFDDIKKRGKQAIMCGGSGLYIESALAGYKLFKVPENNNLRKQLNELTHEELVKKLSELRPLHNTTDTTSRERLIRAIEIDTFQHNLDTPKAMSPDFSYIIFGINFPRETIRQRITERLQNRLEAGMVDEIQRLLKSGLKPEKLIFYGLEYKYITLYVIGEITYDQMVSKLNTAIHQFAKRQMTWFRRMEKNGFTIHWIDGALSNEERVNQIIKYL